jgi:hypothetical protein
VLSAYWISGRRPPTARATGCDTSTRSSDIIYRPQPQHHVHVRRPQDIEIEIEIERDPRCLLTINAWRRNTWRVSWSWKPPWNCTRKKRKCKCALYMHMTGAACCQSTERCCRVQVQVHLLVLTLARACWSQVATHAWCWC